MTDARPINNAVLAEAIFEDAEASWHRDWRIWAVIVILALLVHVLFMATHISWSPSIKPVPVELKTIDPAKLDEIRKKWKNNQPKQLLIDRDKNAPSAPEASDKARYMSDRNIVVQKEQRARQTDVMPKAGAPGGTHSEAAQQKKRTATHAVPRQPKTPPARSANPVHDLSSLGIPLRLSAKSHPEEQEASPPMNSPNQNTNSSGSGGANQWVNDQTLPEGSENMLNAQESVYYSFYARLYDAIAPIWSSKVQQAAYAAHPQPGDYTTVVDVVLNQAGDLLEVRQLQSSGIHELDSVVEPSWRIIGRFPNPPSGLLSPDGTLHMAWSFTMRVGQGGVSFLPPSRAN
ncbi:MAG: TonB C-terminal domain-containing protein [Oligoflexia bacterium]|nr:TonB C-terminal domain-containing protein [Oligoflexia bacterium]